MRNVSKPMYIGGGLALTAVVAFLAFGVFGVHTLFIDDEVDEANPFEVAATTAEGPTDSAPSDSAPSDSAPSDSAPSDEPDDEPSTTEPDQSGAPEATTAPAGSEVVTVTSGTFVDGDHPTSGSAIVITDGSRTFLRFEDFVTDNGPDLNVYLRSSADPDDVIDLGDLKGNIGDQNYELASDIDLGRYDLVDIWCVRFGVSFGSAALAA